MRNRTQPQTTPQHATPWKCATKAHGHLGVHLTHTVMLTNICQLLTYADTVSTHLTASLASSTCSSKENAIPRTGRIVDDNDIRKVCIQWCDRGNCSLHLQRSVQQYSLLFGGRQGYTCNPPVEAKMHQLQLGPHSIL